MAALAFAMLTFLCPVLPAEAFRKVLSQDRMTKNQTAEGNTSPLEDAAATIEEPRTAVSWTKGELVGWVGSPASGHARIISSFDRDGRRFAYVDWLDDEIKAPNLNSPPGLVTGMEEIAIGAQLWSDRAYVLKGTLPAAMRGAQLLKLAGFSDGYTNQRLSFSNMQGSTLFVCSGRTYTTRGFGSCGYQSSLPSMGFTKVTDSLGSQGYNGNTWWPVWFSCYAKNLSSSNIELPTITGETCAQVFAVMPPLLSTDELYKANNTEFGCVSGPDAKYLGPTHNSANIIGHQMGIVQSFSMSDQLVNWWDLQQKKAFAISPLWLQCQQPYWPRQGNAAWVGLYSVNTGSLKIWEKVGTVKTQSEEKTSIWASEVTSTLSGSMRAGVGFWGAGIEVSVGAELSESVRQEHAGTQSYSWSVSVEEGFELTLPPNSGYLWQWQVRTQMQSGEVLTSKTRNFALTDGLWTKPRCVPGYCIDGALCQTCYSEETSIQGLPPTTTTTTPTTMATSTGSATTEAAKDEGREGAAASIKVILGVLVFGLLVPGGL